MAGIQDINRRTPHEKFDARILEQQAKQKTANMVSREMNKRFVETYGMSEVAASRHSSKHWLE